MQWGIEAVAALSATQGGALPDLLPAATPNASAPGLFANLMQGQLEEVGNSVGAAEQAMSALAAGKPVELHDVMISLERARLSVQTFVQVRNKLIESYQDLMRMQL